MSKAKTLKVGLLGAAALLMLSSCASRDEVANLGQRVSTLESRIDIAESRAQAAEAKAGQLEAAASQCTATCRDAEARAERVYQQSLRK